MSRELNIESILRDIEAFNGNVKADPNSKTSKQKIDNLKAKAKVMGLEVQVLPTMSNVECTLILKRGEMNILYIPDEVRAIADEYDDEFNSIMKRIRGGLKVIGGHGLINATRLFKDIRLDMLDLTDFYTTRVENMTSMFEGATVGSIIGLKDLNVENLVTMENTFAESDIDIIDLSGWYTPNLTDMKYAFNECQASQIIFERINTEKVTDMSYTFNKCRNVDKLDLSAFNTRNVYDMTHMFSDSTIKYINIRSFDTNEVRYFDAMFKCFETSKLNLENFEFRNVASIQNMFENMRAKSLYVPNLDLDRFEGMEDEDTITIGSDIEDIRIGW